MRILLLVTACALVGIPMVSYPVRATPFEMDDFVRISGPETVNPRFDIGGGITTAVIYSGFVEVLVSGTGLNDIGVPESRTDAFYRYDTTVNQPLFIDGSSLRLGFEYQVRPLPAFNPLGFHPFVPNCVLHWECVSIHAFELAVAYAGGSYPLPNFSPELEDPAPWVPDRYMPDFSEIHVYRMVLDLGSYVGRLTFGMGDGGTFDNSSDVYNVTIYQAALSSPNPVPEAASTGLLLAGLGLLGLRRRIQRHPTPHSALSAAKLPTAMAARMSAIMRFMKLML